MTDTTTDTDGTGTAEGEPPEADQNDIGPNDIPDEVHARRLGWKPKEEFEGDDDKWCDAAEFLKRAERNGGLAITNNRRLQQQLDRMQETLDDQARAHQTLMDAQEKRIHKEYQDKMRAAVRDGNVEEFDRLEAERSREMEAFKKTETETPKAQSSEPPEVTEWRDANDWYGTDTAMTAVADRLSQQLVNEQPDLPVREHLRRVKAMVKEEFPHKFDTGRPPPADVEGAPRRNAAGGAGKSKKKTYENMPPEDQRACDRAVKVGMVPDRDTFVKSYYELKEADDANV